MLALPPRLLHRYSISSEWKKDIKPIASHYCGAWLQTEYNTATLRAKFAAEWKQYEADADIMPNLRWMPTTSANPEEEHKGYWMNRLTLPVGDKFWDKHHPGDHWNCKCSLEQTDEPANPDVLSHIPDVKPQKGLAANPGKTGEMFDDSHPYFPMDCEHCWANHKNGLNNLFSNSKRKKHCSGCKKMNTKMKEASEMIRSSQDVQPPHIEDYTPLNNEMVMISNKHGENEREENIRLAEFINQKLGKKVYLLPRLDPTKAEEAPLRSTYIPKGVKEGKSPDFYIGGILFEGKCMHSEYTTNKKSQHNKVLNHIKDAKEQADNMIIEVPDFISRRVITNTVNGYINQSSKKRIIIIKHRGKCYVYK